MAKDVQSHHALIALPAAVSWLSTRFDPFSQITVDKFEDAQHSCAKPEPTPSADCSASDTEKIILARRIRDYERLSNKTHASRLEAESDVSDAYSTIGALIQAYGAMYDDGQARIEELSCDLTKSVLEHSRLLDVLMTKNSLLSQFAAAQDEWRSRESDFTKKVSTLSSELAVTNVTRWIARDKLRAAETARMKDSRLSRAKIGAVENLVAHSESQKEVLQRQIADYASFSNQTVSDFARSRIRSQFQEEVLAKHTRMLMDLHLSCSRDRSVLRGEFDKLELNFNHSVGEEIDTQLRLKTVLQKQKNSIDALQKRIRLLERELDEVEKTTFRHRCGVFLEIVLGALVLVLASLVHEQYASFQEEIARKDISQPEDLKDESCQVQDSDFELLDETAKPGTGETLEGFEAVGFDIVEDVPAKADEKRSWFRIWR